MLGEKEELLPLCLSVLGEEWTERIRIGVAPLSGQEADPVHGLPSLKS